MDCETENIRHETKNGTISLEAKENGENSEPTSEQEQEMGSEIGSESISGSESDLSKSPVFTSEMVEKIDRHEDEGVALQTPWTFWLDRAITGSTTEEYKANLKKIYTVSTVQSFWAVFNHIPNAGDIQNRYSYHLMRDERYPLWEEPMNQNGGTWRFKCLKTDTPKVWMEVVVAAIGEQFSECVAEDDEVVGVTVSIRDRDDLIQIWNIDANLSSKAKVIEKVHQIVPDIKFLGEFYKPHHANHAFNRKKVERV